MLLLLLRKTRYILLAQSLERLHPRFEGLCVSLLLLLLLWLMLLWNSKIFNTIATKTKYTIVILKS